MRGGELHNRHWQELCRRFLPIAPEGSVWRYSRSATSEDLDQGWKLHISATVLSANEVFERAGPLLARRQVLFKAPVSLWELARINAGLSYGYCQVGKFITVYPRSNSEAAYLAARLDKLTRSYPAPQIPFDLKLRPRSNVYFRYGAFRHLEMTHFDGSRLAALKDPAGNLAPDLRYSPLARPEWADIPFQVRTVETRNRSIENPLNSAYRGFLALSQRGKGGVYKALDFTSQSPRVCILKEGRRHGEVGWDGRDGFWRIENEERALLSLRASGVDVPRVYSSFVVGGNRYLATEFIAGEDLHAFLTRRRHRLTITSALDLGLRLAELVQSLHRAGWAWRDCKPSNLIVTREGLRPIDFEGACPVDCGDPVPWGTPAFVAPEWRSSNNSSSGIPEDLYSVGAVVYFLLTGKTPNAEAPTPIQKLRDNVPTKLRALVGQLLSSNPERRPTIEDAVRRLRKARRV